MCVFFQCVRLPYFRTRSLSLALASHVCVCVCVCLCLCERKRANVTKSVCVSLGVCEGGKSVGESEISLLHSDRKIFTQICKHAINAARRKKQAALKVSPANPVLPLEHLKSQIGMIT